MNRIFLEIFNSRETRNINKIPTLSEFNIEEIVEIIEFTTQFFWNSNKDFLWETL